ncbi:MAG: phosphoribosyltransferase [Ignavibacteria bacterium]|nr:phosphoribosyltransferase [Ignavibacteria bacterium]
MFKDRKHAAKIIADKLKEYRSCKGVVIAIPKGGVILGYELAMELNLPLEIMLSQKIGHPYNPEYSIGTVSLYGAIVRDDFGITEEYLKQETEKARKSLILKHKLYMSGRKPVDFKNMSVIIVDDGIATGNTMLSMIEMVSKSEPAQIIIAVPVASRSAIESIKENVNVLIYCLTIPENFYAVSQVYNSFEQISDDEVINLLNQANKRKVNVCPL